MSKARSPRDVCSTTMGTSGLMVLASVRRRLSNSCRGSLPTGRPRPAGLFLCLGPGGPELVGVARGLVGVGRPEVVAVLALLRRRLALGGGLLLRRGRLLRL